ncbi:uncharacterized protein [Coffea arabica]|uniref:RNA-directed DNA polymerase n=1 Tax=Coffea arabica TaxID=13443 RepID=A0ABM4VQI7_COFAR
MPELIDKATKIERRLKRRGNPRNPNFSATPLWRGNPTFEREWPSTGVSKFTPKSEPPKQAPKATPKPPFDSSKPRSRDKCFKCQGFGHIASQCPNRRTMVVLPSGDVISDDEDEFAEMPPLIDEGDVSEVEVEATTEQVGVALVARRALATQVKRVDEAQRDNIFYTRCHVKGRVCSLIIDAGSCTNVASTLMVNHLSLPTLRHPSPHHLQWLNESGDVKVTKQVVVPFRIGKYEDNVLCDVVPMQASHILLGRPWQYDKKTTHDGFTNKYSFLHHNKKMTLVPLTPQQVHEDQLRLQQEHERELAKKSNNSKAIIKAPAMQTSTPSTSGRLDKRPSLLAKNREVRKLLLSKQEFEHVFPNEVPSGLPPLRGIEHQIDFVPRASLPNRSAYKMGPEETEEIQWQVDELLEKGWAQESMSPCAVPVILVPKKEGTWRMCMDCRAVNAITVKYRHPIPRLDDLFDELYGAVIFTKINLKSGYHQIRMKEGDEWKTAFKTKYGKFVVVYFDDILIYSKSPEEHVAHVSAQGIRVDESKVQAINEWLVPKTMSEVRSFHGLANFYRRFVKEFSTIAAPLTAIIKKDVQFEWGEAQEKAFQLLKHKLTHAPLLFLPSFDKAFEVEYDAFGVGIGAVLIQEGRPTAYFSEKLNGAALNYSTYDKELYALIRALETWQHYLRPKEFVIHTDHEALKHLKCQQKLNKRHVRWVNFVESFPYVIKYKAGKTNVVADALSRRYALTALLDAKLLGFDLIKDLYDTDSDFSDIYASCVKSGQVHSATQFSPFKIVYGFNPLTPLDLMPLPLSERTNLDGKKKAKFVQALHQQVRANIEARTQQYLKHANKGRRRVVFEPGDWVWLHLRKERFPVQRHNKLLPRGDRPFQVVGCINDNACKLDLPGEYNVSATFNVANLSPYLADDAVDLKTNLSQEGGNDETVESAILVEQVKVPLGPMTRARAKRLNETLQTLVRAIRESSGKPKAIEGLNETRDITLLSAIHED